MNLLQNRDLTEKVEHNSKREKRALKKYKHI